MITCDCTIGAGADFHLGTDAAEGANFHILGETGVGIDQGGRMNLHKTPASLKLK